MIPLQWINWSHFLKVARKVSSTLVVCVCGVLLCATLFKFAHKNIGISVNIIICVCWICLALWIWVWALSFVSEPFFSSKHFRKMVLYFAACGSFNVKLKTELICILHWKWFLEKANVIHHQQRCDVMRREMENSVWVWTESYWYGHGTISSLFEITTTTTTTTAREGKNIHFRLYVNLVVVVPFFRWVELSIWFLVASCTSEYKSWIMESPTTEDIRFLMLSKKKYDRWDQTFVHLRFWSSPLSLTHIQKWKSRKKSQRNGRYYQSQTCIHTYTHTFNAYNTQAARQKSISNTGKANINYIWPG